mmetsp:Transcript_58094/g.79177  ORF Transcript_58094/g.79177 Transcript_58094/m.79177 type:complete len:220 (-) Transcript_58094:1248-1907(-)
MASYRKRLKRAPSSTLHPTGSLRRRSGARSLRCLSPPLTRLALSLLLLVPWFSLPLRPPPSVCRADTGPPCSPSLTRPPRETFPVDCFGPVSRLEAVWSRFCLPEVCPEAAGSELFPASLWAVESPVMLVLPRSPRPRRPLPRLFPCRVRELLSPLITFLGCVPSSSFCSALTAVVTLEPGPRIVNEITVPSAKPLASTSSTLAGFSPPDALNLSLLSS